jgi:transcriptional regulator with XRE-family HTH domain
MGNNLKFYIKLSGKTQVEVAKLKGIAPESLSRHISGRSQFSIQDALEYAAILGCTPEQLLFEQKPIEVLGTVHADETVTMRDSMEPKEFIQMNMTPQDNWGLMRMEHTGSWKYADGGYLMIDTKGIQERRVLTACNGARSLVKTKEGCIQHALVYPQPDGKYTLTGVWQAGNIRQNVELVCGCPILSVAARPDLLGWQKWND